MTSTVLLLKWTTSRGQDTYGYNVVTLTDTDTHKRYRCMGGGYDMVGTVFGEWLQDVHRASLAAVANRAHATYGPRPSPDEPFERIQNPSPDALYGMTAYDDDDVEVRSRNPRVRLDGGCGLESMRRIAEAIGLNVRAILDRKGNYEGFTVES